jgi:hypothetical protein
MSSIVSRFTAACMSTDRPGALPVTCLECEQLPYRVSAAFASAIIAFGGPIRGSLLFRAPLLKSAICWVMLGDRETRQRGVLGASLSVRQVAEDTGARISGLRPFATPRAWAEMLSSPGS